MVNKMKDRVNHGTYCLFGYSYLETRQTVSYLLVTVSSMFQFFSLIPFLRGTERTYKKERQISQYEQY